ncbi:unnamed protein product [Rodentolepis nana]|uniref:Ig-like domain-containing protein n=1 Tax=Rodentolepis nana TaxID=102285 RepID=A0A0R3T506_RODNA|nr:unnamed protein product [Rodentolepis nana]
MLSVCVNRVHSVTGCITFVNGDDYNEKASICERLDTHFTRIPPTLPKEVVRLTINHQEIAVLDRSQLDHLPNLTYLNLDSNMLSVIKRDAFLPVPNLRELSLRFNQLTLSVESFHPNALTPINTLEVLNLKRNPIGRVPAHFFYPIRGKLKSLVLAGASPEFHISTEALEGLFKLELLDLSYNNLETLHSSFNGLFTTMQLKQLFLFGNPWKCDCSLRWLRDWVDRHNTTQYFIDPRAVDPTGFVIDPLLQMEPGSLENTAFPKCASPPRLAGYALFPISNVQTNPVSPFDMACPPKSKKSSTVVLGKLGENITLICEFEASSVDEVLWYHNGHPIISTSRVRVRQLFHGHVAVELFMPEIQESNAGTYVCLLKNDFGKANMTVTLTLTDLKWGTGGPREPGWLDQFNSNAILKYSSIASIVLVLIFIIIGVILYCLCRKTTKNVAKALNNSTHPKTTFTELSPLNGVQTFTVDETMNYRRAQPPRYSPSREMSFSQQHHPYILSFQDSHPLYSMAEHGTMELSPGCPVHGLSKSSTTFLPKENSFDSSSPQFDTLDKTGLNTYETALSVPEVIMPPASSSSVISVDDPPVTNPDYVLCPRHGNVVTTLGTPSMSEGIRKDSQISPVVRSTRTIRLNHPFPPPLKNSGHSTLKTKHVEFADTPTVTSTTATASKIETVEDNGAVLISANGDKSSGFITTV